MVRRLPPSMLLVALLAIALVGCGNAPAPGVSEQDVKVKTDTALSLAQYRANRDFALGYQATCTPPDPKSTRRRALVTGFGRFQSNRTNATGLAAATLLDELDYPMTDPAPAGEIDPPAPQLAVAQGVVELPQSGEVELCVMILPVYWDLSALLVLKEMEAFDPDFVLMNGIAGSRQNLWFELGAINQATTSADGSNILGTVAGSTLIEAAGDTDTARPNLLSWDAVRDAADAAIATDAATTPEAEVEGEALSSVLTGTELKPFPRYTNTYLCNNTTFTVGYLMDHPGQTVALMEASEGLEEGEAGSVPITLDDDRSDVPRVFLHWPSRLEGAQLDAAGRVLRAVVDAQLATLDDAVHGDNAMAE